MSDIFLMFFLKKAKANTEKKIEINSNELIL